MEQAISLLLVLGIYFLGMLVTSIYELKRLKFSTVTNFIFSSWMGLIIYLFTIECRRMYLWIITKLFIN